MLNYQRVFGKVFVFLHLLGSKFCTEVVHPEVWAALLGQAPYKTHPFELDSCHQMIKWNRANLMTKPIEQSHSKPIQIIMDNLVSSLWLVTPCIPAEQFLSGILRSKDRSGEIGDTWRRLEANSFDNLRCGLQVSLVYCLKPGFHILPDDHEDQGI